MELRGAGCTLWSAFGVNCALIRVQVWPSIRALMSLLAKGTGCCICEVTLSSPHAHDGFGTADLYRVKIWATANCWIYKALVAPRNPVSALGTSYCSQIVPTNVPSTFQFD